MAKANEDRKPPALAAGRILVVDDDAGLNNLAQKALRRRGFETHGALSGAEAIASVIANPELMLLLDQQLPDMAGTELVRALIERGHRVPFVAMTGHGDEQVAVEMMKLGARDYLIKGINLTDLLPDVFQRVLRELETERRLALAEKQLRESERRLRSLFDNMLEGFAYCKMVYDNGIPIDFLYIEVNKSFGKLTGLHEVAGKKVSEVIPDFRVSDKNLFDIYGRVANGGAPEQFEIFVKSLEMWFSISAYCPEKGFFVAVFDVITDRKKIEEAMQRSRDMLRQILDTIPQGIFWKDTKSVYFGCNRVFADNVGLNNIDDIIGKTDFDLPWLQQDTEAYRADDAYVIANSKPKMHIIEQAMNRAGERIWVDTSKMPLLDQQGQVYGVLGIYEDISERTKAAEELKRAMALAEASNRSKSEFLANMSHEIRTPLNGVLGMLQLLQTTGPTDEQKEYILAAIKSSRRLTRLLADILDLSRIEAGKLVLEETEFAIINQKQAVMELFAEAARQKDLDLDFFLDARLPPKLIGDETRLRQILFNLVGNAIKFTEKGRVRVEVSPVDAPCKDCLRVLFTVEDTGVGIPEDRLKDIFEPFVQAEGSYTRRFQGAGLGLSIVRKLVKLMGGDLSIDSVAGEGTTIYLSFPFKLPGARPGQAEPAVPAAGGSASPPLRILIAEDDEVCLISGARMLEKSGYAVVTAKDGQEALARLAGQDFDLVLMDVQMPVMDGVEATRRIRASGAAHAGVPIIAMTAYAMAGDREKLLAAGMDDYLAKPVEMEALTAVIQRVLSKRRSQ
jgi:PAS domain S-box-containing protein